MKDDYLFQQSRSLVPLNSMRESHLLAALEQAKEVACCKNDVLFDESEPQDSLYYLLSGEVLLKHQKGRERIITAHYHWLPIVQFQTELFSATVLTDCHLLRFNRHHLDNLVTWSQVADYLDVDISYERERDDDFEWMASILNSNLFYKIPPINVLSIYSKISPVDVRQGEIILRQGDHGDYCYFIKEGKAVVTQADGLYAPTKKIAEIGPGRCFGEDALIKQTTRNATVKMISDGVLMRLHKDDFMTLLVDPSTRHISSCSLDQADSHQYQYLDVRTQEEFDYKHLRDALHIPLNLLRLKVRLLDPEKHYLVYCNSGLRSKAAAYLLEQKNYNVSVLSEGLASISNDQVESLLVGEYDEYHRLAMNVNNGDQDCNFTNL